MKMKKALTAAVGCMLILLLAACGKLSAGSAPIHAVTDETTYLDYAGYQFSGADPWGGTLAVTINSIIDGKMEWTFTDSFEGHTLYQVQQGTVLQDGKAAFDIQGSDVENEGVTFAYQGALELKDGKVTVTFDSGAVTNASTEGDSTYRIAEALSGSGLPDQVVLDRTVDGPYVSYTVQSGDSIHSIAKAHGISTKDLCILNQVVIIETAKSHGYEFEDVTEYAKYLYPGEVLLVPNDK